MEKIIYKKLNIDSGRVFVIGDLHGCATLLKNTLTSVNFDYNNDTLISVGDLIDRGYENLECLSLLDEPFFHCVLGNHEQMAIDKHYEHWVRNGGLWYYTLTQSDRVVADNYIEKLKLLPHVLEVNFKGKKIVICHADYTANEYEYGKKFDPESVIWNRERFKTLIESDGEEGILEGADAFYFGHTPVNSARTFNNINYIDTGGVFTGKLTMIEL